MYTYWLIFRIGICDNVPIKEIDLSQHKSYIINYYGLPWVVTSTRAGKIYDLCVFFMMETPKGSTESGSGEAWNQIYNPWLLPPKPKFTFRHLKKGIQEFHRKFVLAPADKAANNVVVV